jgi:hypothetical protein
MTVTLCLVWYLLVYFTHSSGRVPYHKNVTLNAFNVTKELLHESSSTIKSW